MTWRRGSININLMKARITSVEIEFNDCLYRANIYGEADWEFGTRRFLRGFTSRANSFYPFQKVRGQLNVPREVKDARRRAQSA